MPGSRVVVAMSGGVDSSVAAARLLAAGYDVVGVTLHLWDYPDDGSVQSRCCAPEDVHDARRVADQLGFPHYAFDRREAFRTEVVDPFIDAYVGGQTPSPCVHCNRSVKMRELLNLAQRFDAEAVATGHYARIVSEADRPWLHRARDPDKDQSYFLHMLGETTLRRLRFPLGEATKSEVREEALRLGLPGASKGESQELCFVPSGRYDSFVSAQAPERVRRGPIVDEQGNQLGTHEGIHRFTVGQRKNLGVSAGRRLYVVQVEPDTSTVRLGPREQVMTQTARVKEPVFRDGLPERCEVQVRYRARPVPARLRVHGDEVELSFEVPVPAVVPGQFAVFYDGSRVLGGGLITSGTSVQASTQLADSRLAGTL